jgi:AdoMet-dependent heme synthase
MTISQSHDFLIQWHLTERCNLRCSHCYQTGEKRDEMSLGEIINVADELSEMFRIWSDSYELVLSPSFNVTGGEPFLRTDLFRILETIGNKGFEIYILSNGTLIDKAKAMSLVDLGVKGVQISIEGPEEIHDFLRGKGSFSSSLTGIKHLIDARVPVTMNVTLSKINAGFFTDIVDIACSLGVTRLGYSRLVPSGRGSSLTRSTLGTKQVKKLYEKFFSMDNKGVELVTGDPVANQMDSSIEVRDSNIAAGGCAAGVSGLTILSDGTITPCRRLPIPVGNVRRDSIRELWAISEVFRGLRNRDSYTGKCGSCKRWANCRGCRAIAYAYSQADGREDFLGADPHCFVNEPLTEDENLWT